jgi:hypothetical protein
MLVDFDSSGTLLVSEWSDDTVRIHDIAAGREVAAFPLAFSTERSAFGAYRQSPDGRWLAWIRERAAPARSGSGSEPAAGEGTELPAWTWASTTCRAGGGSTGDVSLSPDGELSVMGTEVVRTRASGDDPQGDPRRISARCVGHRRAGRNIDVAAQTRRLGDMAGLPNDSVANASQLVTIHRAFLVERGAKLSPRLLEQIMHGIGIVLGR